MSTETLYLKDFEHRPGFHPEIELLVTIKSFDLQAIRKRYIESRKRAKSGNHRTGSVARRQPSEGGVARVRLQNSQIDSEVLAKLIEPRGIAVGQNRLAIAAEDRILRSGLAPIRYPWFSYLHTVAFHPTNPDRIVVSSSGFDAFFEFEWEEDQPCREWFAWEHGFDTGSDRDGNPIILTRSAARAAEAQAEGLACMLIPDPPQEAVPTAQRAAFINSVDYNHDGSGFLATFFHEGAVFEIGTDRKAVKRIEGLKNPHGGRVNAEHLMATSTGTGEIVVQKNGDQLRYHFDGLEGKPPELEGLEWIQNSALAGTNSSLIIAIDSNRTSFVLFDTELKCYDRIPYNPDWAVQDLAVIPNNANDSDELLEAARRMFS